MDKKRKKTNIYKKSKYYKQQRQRMLVIAGGAGILVLLLLIFLIVRMLSPEGKGASAASSDQSGTEIAEENLTIETSEDSEAASDTATVSEPVSLTVSLTGDCTLGTDENFDYSTSLNAYYESSGSAYFFQNVRSIFEQDDLTIVNMEGTLTTSETREDKLYAFKADPSYVSILTDGSVEAANLANNHSQDYGQQSLEDTKTALDGAGITHFGYDETAVIDVKGVKVGLVGIYELYDHMERAQQLKDNISKVKEEGAQLVIVSFHWGNEKETVPDSNQTQLGHMAIDAGADLVVGHHPHVLQGIEKYNGKYIVYSLGNFCFGGNSAPSDMDTMIFQQTFTITSEGVQTDDNINIIPCRISSVYDYNNYQPTPCEDGEEKDRILAKIQERSSAISDTMDFYFQNSSTLEDTDTADVYTE